MPSAPATQHKNQKRSLAGSSARRRSPGILSPISSAAQARPPLLPRSSGANGSSPTSAGSLRTRRASACSRHQMSSRSWCRTSASGRGAHSRIPQLHPQPLQSAADRRRRYRLALLLHVDRQRGELEESNVALLNGALVEHFARDAHEAHVEVGARRFLLGDFVDLEGVIPAEDVNAARARSVLARADSAPKLGRDLAHVAHGDRRVDSANVHHAAALGAV